MSGPQNQGDTPVLLNIPEACARLRVSRWTFYQLVRTGRLRTVTVGSRRLVPVANLNRFIEELQQDAGGRL